MKWGMLACLRSAAIGIVAFSSVVATMAHAQTIELSYSYWTHEKSAVGDTMKWWADEVEARSSGDVKVNIFWSEAMAKFGDSFTAAREGQVDIAELAAVFSMSETPAWALTDTGAGSSDPYVATVAVDNLRGTHPQLDEELAANGLKYLWHYSWGGLVLMGKGDPVLVPSDFSGQNVRVSSWLAEAIRSEGWDANPVQISIADMLQGLERGTVGGGSNYWHAMPRFAEVIDWVTVLNEGQKTAVVVMNEEVWNALSDRAKAAIDELRPLMLEKLSAGQVKEAEAHAELLKSKGITVTELDETQSAPWGEGMRRSFDARAEKLQSVYPDAVQFREDLLAEIDAVAEQVSASNYPWE